MKRLIVLILSVFLLTGVNLNAAEAGQAIVSWTAPATNVDGTPAIVIGYKVHYGTVSKTYTVVKDVGSVLTYTITGLAPGTWFFAVTAYNAGGDSAYSNEASKFITMPVPVPPMGCTVK